MNTTTAGTLEHLDPSTLVLETNVRTAPALTKAFVADIRERGIRTPVEAWRDPSGTVHVRAGQRRTTAALEIGLPTIPVFLVDADDADTAARIIDQLNENEHREALNDGDRISAWHQLEMEGLSVATIAKRTGAEKARVTSGLAVAKSETGNRLVQEVALTLDQAADLIEFEDDAKLVDELTETATTDPAYFPVAVQRARDSRERHAVCAAATEAEEAKGHTILDPTQWSEPGTRLRALLTADGEAVTVADVEGKEGVSVRITASRDYETKVMTADVTHYVTDPAALGLTLRPGYGSSSTQGPMTDAQKAERKTLIANNKEWDAAETVRREWLTNLIARKALPKNAAQVIAASLTSHRYKVSQAMSQGNTVASQLLGVQKDYQRDVLGAYLDKNPARAGHVSLAVVLGGLEETTSRNTWRNPDDSHATYLNTLAGWGYNLCPVERIAAKLAPETES